MNNQKISFDLSSINRHTIIKNIFECEHLLASKKLSIDSVFLILKKQIQKHYPVLVRKKHSADRDLLVGGWFLIENDICGKKSIVIDIFLPKKQYISISKIFFSKIANIIADTILHELIHLRQYRSCNYQLDYNPSHFSNIEIQAHGFNIACELLDSVSKKVSIQKIIEHNEISKFSNTWNMYLELCEYNDRHTVMKKLKNQVVKYIPLAERGFPFKSGKWLK